MDIRANRVVGESGAADWVIYEGGNYTRPILILSEYQMGRLFEQFKQAREQATKGRKYLRQEVSSGDNRS